MFAVFTADMVKEKGRTPRENGNSKMVLMKKGRLEQKERPPVKTVICFFRCLPF